MSTSVTTRASAAAMQQAFDALRTYGPGSPRGSLVGLDEAVTRSTTDPTLARELEARLLGVLEARPPVEAVDYICRKLALIGSVACVPAMASLLQNSARAHAGRSVLEVLPGSEAGDALRAALPTLVGIARLEAVIALGMRREPASVTQLTSLLKDADVGCAGLAAGALGEIGDGDAAAVLGAFLPTAPTAIRAAVANAGLACAERLAKSGATKQAVELYRLLASADQAPHIRSAAELGLKASAAGSDVPWPGGSAP